MLCGGEKPNARLSVVLVFGGFLFLGVIHALPFEAASQHQRPSQCRCLCWCLHFTGEGEGTVPMALCAPEGERSLEGHQLS